MTRAGDNDRQRASELLAVAGVHRHAYAEDAIAAALAEAEQRGAARAVQPFRELADLMDRDPWHKLRGDDIAARIRAVADVADRRG